MPKQESFSEMAKANFGRFRTIFFFSLIVLLTVAVLYLLKPFLYPIFWAAVIAVVFYPIYRTFLKHIRNESVSSLFTIIVVILTIFIPLMLVVSLIISQTFELYSAASQSNLLSDSSKLIQWLQNSFLGPYIDYIRNESSKHIADFARTAGGFLLDNVRGIIENTFKLFRFVFMLFIMFYTLFFFFKDGESLVRRVMHLSPLGNEYEKMLADRFSSTTRATLKSTFLVGGVQGLLAFIVFWIAGIPGSLIWGVLTVFAAMVPAIGTFVIWLPIGVITLLMGNVWQGLLILLVGMLVISTIDNLLKPVLIGKDVQLHPLLVLFSTLGGIALFGISGFIIGPVIAAFYMSVISIYDHYYVKELNHN